MRIGGPSAALILDTTDRPGYMGARLQSEGLRAEHTIYRHYDSGFRDLADFFDSLERDWRGWAGVRTWTSLEGDLEIRANHDGHVQLAVRLQPAPDRLWTATAYLTIDPGEELTIIAKQSRQLALTTAGQP